MDTFTNTSLSRRERGPEYTRKTRTPRGPAATSRFLIMLERRLIMRQDTDAMATGAARGEAREPTPPPFTKNFRGY